MKKICVKETTALSGMVNVQGSKNTVLPVMAATLLSSGITVISNCPDIEDVHAMCALLECLHVKTDLKRNVLTIDTSQAAFEPLPFCLTGKLRSSILLSGAMLAKWHRAELGMPGGCAIGRRPIDLHLEGFVRMHADVRLQQNMLICESFYLQGCDYHLRFPSVGATENMLLAAAGAKGRTVLRGAAVEPEIVELCRYLVSMGVLIEGIGTDVLVIKGTGSLAPSNYENVYDRIVAGTYLLAAAGIPGRFLLKGISDTAYMENSIDVAVRLGVRAEREQDGLLIQSTGVVRSGLFESGIHPAFPTDLLPVLIPVLLKAEGESRVRETIFENRLGIVKELNRLGAGIRVNGQTASIPGGVKLSGGSVTATDLRQGAGLVIAGLMMNGTTVVSDIGYIERGYEDIVRDLQAIGAQVHYDERLDDGK